MKAFFASVGAVFAVFLAVIAWGAVLPATLVVERSAALDAAPADVFDVLEDLGTYPEWSRHLPPGSVPAFGERIGEGAALAWDQGGDAGSVEVMQSVPLELVRLGVQQGRRDAVATLAIAEGADGGTVIVSRDERRLGGFPFLSRVRAKLAAGGVEAQMDTELDRLNRAIPPAG